VSNAKKEQQMSCVVEVREGTIHVIGEMTIYAAATIKEDLFAVMAAKPQECHLNLSNVTELDMCGLQVLLMAQRACESRSARFTVVQSSPAVREIMDLLRIENLRAASAAAEA
jgi:anti-sigma B factor antagonist